MSFRHRYPMQMFFGKLVPESRLRTPTEIANNFTMTNNLNPQLL